MSHTPILHVAIHKPVRHCFDYLFPSSLIPSMPQPGMRVLVPFGKRELVGVILSIDDTSSVDQNKLKPIIAVLDQTPILPTKLCSFYQRVSQYYQHPIGEVILGTLPTLLRQKKDPKTRKQKDTSATSLTPFAAEIAPVLNTEQQAAVDIINAVQGFKIFLLQGVTGSGKTEVYLRVIDDYLARGKQALVLVPEIGLTPQTISRFQRRFAVCIAVFHSKLSLRQRLESWEKARSGEARIIIGTRSSIFTPAKNLGIIVLDEEHDASFKQQSGFRYSARDLAILRGQSEKAVVVLGTATPSLETLHNVNLGRFELLRLTLRAGKAIPPVFRVVDLRGQYLEEGLSEKLLLAIQAHLANDNQVLLFLNRRGYAPVLLCHACGWSAGCHRCDAKLTLHQSPPRLVCHHCVAIMSVPKCCGSCQSDALFDIGVGTEKVEIALKKHFPDVEVLRIDRDTIRTKRAMEEMLSKITNGRRQILLGTQMLAKGHHFPNVTLVGILDIDSGFYSTDFRALESTGQLIVQVAGRAGRAEKPGEVYLQTHQPEHPLLEVLIKEDYGSFAKHLLLDRERAGWPPFSFLVLLRAEAKHRERPLQFLTEVKQIGRGSSRAVVQLLGPIPAPMQKKAGSFRAILLVQSSQRKMLQSWLSYIVPLIGELASAKRVKWSVDVDPLDMF